MAEGWMENSKGNHVWVDLNGVRATVYATDDGMWAAIWNGGSDGRSRRLKGKFDNAAEAQFGVEEADRQGECSNRWYPPDDEWRKRKGGGYYRRLKGVVISVKQASSGSWYVTSKGTMLREDGRPRWFATAEDACAAAATLIAGQGGDAWVYRQ